MNTLAEGLHGRITAALCIAGQFLILLLPLTEAHAEEADKASPIVDSSSCIKDGSCASLGNSLGYSSIHRSQENMNGTSISGGKITFGNQTLRDSVANTGGDLSTSQLSTATNHPENAREYYTSGRSPTVEGLQSLNTQSESEIADTTDSAASSMKADSESANPTVQGMVYGAINGNYQKRQGQLKDTDPIFGPVEDLRENVTGNPFGDCSLDYKLISRKQKTHTVKKAYCTDDAVKPCTLTHELEFAVAQPVENVQVSACHDHRANCAAFEAGTPHGAGASSLNSGSCGSSTVSASLSVLARTAITKVQIYSVAYAGAAYGYLTRTSSRATDRKLFAVKGNPTRQFDGPTEDQGFTCSNGQLGLSAYVGLDITSEFKNNDVFTFSIDSKGAPASALIEIDYNPVTLAGASDAWGDDACRRSASAVAQAGSDAGSVECTQKAAVVDNAVCVSGVCVDKQYISTVAGLPPECTEAKVSVNQSVYGGEGSPISQCSDLDSQGCGYMGEECAKYASDNSSCLFTRKVYDCGYTDDVEVTVPSKRYDCPGGIQCQGIDCANIMIGDASADMAKALGLMQQAQQAQNDMKCETADGKAVTDIDLSKSVASQTDVVCSFFPGEYRKCYDWDINLGAHFGNNCCDDPSSSADWAQYTRKIFNLWKFQGIRDMFLTNPFGVMGTWDGSGLGLMYGSGGMTSLVGTVWDLEKKFTPWGKAFTKVEGKILNPFVNGLNNLIPYAGEVFKGAVYMLEDQVMIALSKFMIEVAAEAMYKLGLISASAAAGIISKGYDAFDKSGGMSELVQKGVTALAEKAGFGAETAASIGAAAGTIVTVVGWVYLAYQITKMIAALVTKCDNKDFELATKRRLNQCDYIGKYCAKRQPLTHHCMKTAKGFCCFQSPLSRILNKQVRYALNNCYPVYPDADPRCAFGGAEEGSSHCGGLTTVQIAAVDWTHVDLTEWLQLLQTSGALDTTGGLSSTASEYLPIGGYDQAGRKHDASNQASDAVSETYNPK